MVSKSSAFETQVLATLTRRWRELVPDDAFDGMEASADDIAERMLRAVPLANVFNESIGPFYDGPGLAKWLGVVKQRLTTLRKQGRLLGITSSRGRPLYPSFQFGPTGQLLPDLPVVRDELDPVMPNDLTIARWLNTPTTRFEGRTAAQLLKAGEREPVVDAARDDAARLLR